MITEYEYNEAAQIYQNFIINWLPSVDISVSSIINK